MSDKTGDEAIVALYFARSERAIALTEQTYGKLIFSVCRNVLHNDEDAEECCSSVYMSAWSKIPPERPKSLPAFLCFLARTCAIDRYREKTRKRRGAGQSVCPFEELENLLSGGQTAQEALEEKELTKLLNDFLRTLPDDERRLFIRRYYLEESADTIAEKSGVSRRTVYMKLSAVRDKLEEMLKKEGYLP